jgi:hypothetical protein
VRRAARGLKRMSEGTRRIGPWWVATGITVIGVCPGTRSRCKSDVCSLGLSRHAAANKVLGRPPGGDGIRSAGFHRDAAVADGVANAIGVSVGLGASSLMRVIRQRREGESKATVRPVRRSSSLR